MTKSYIIMEKYKCSLEKACKSSNKQLKKIEIAIQIAKCLNSLN